MLYNEYTSYDFGKSGKKFQAYLSHPSFVFELFFGLYETIIETHLEYWK